MSQPDIDKIYMHYTILRDSLKVTGRGYKSPAQSRLLKGTIFEVQTDGEYNTNSLETRNELDDLIILSMFSVFETWMHDLVLNQMGVLKTILPADFGARLYEYVEKEIEWWKNKDVIHFFKCMTPGTNSKMLQIKDYRDWVAHGKKIGKKPINTDPETVYTAISSFISETDLALRHPNPQHHSHP
ncbi:MAG: hypothetical protein PHW04_12695 [Candidatus Wallbacteria bacterium]|nr:hypothetical protein [Candidatus Wallbacteria bacterium]